MKVDVTETNADISTELDFYSVKPLTGDATDADRAQHALLVGRQRTSKLVEELRFVRAKDIGHFEPMSVHDDFLRCPFLRAARGAR